LLRQVVQRLFHETGNGRALENAHRAVERDRFVHERIAALERRLPAPSTPATPAIRLDDRGAA
jgi:hypothetical protein